jgi:hypothetical protein
MAFGPIELLVVKFPGNQFSGEIRPALKELVDTGTIRVIDILFILKAADGEARMIELAGLDHQLATAFDPIISDITGLLSPADAQLIADALENDSSAAIMLFENTWATRFTDAVRGARGEVVLNERIPRKVIEELLAAQSTS